MHPFKNLCAWLLVIALSACRPAAPTAPLRLAVLPILDALPLYVAQSEGYFAARGVPVELVSVASAAERDQLLQAGQIDGIITDLAALALYDQNAPQVIAVRYAMRPTASFAQFRILAAANASLRTPADLRDVPIGVSEGTVIEYVTLRTLTAAGLPAESVATLAVPRIPDRMALLASGELRAATLPEPLASLALQQGAVLIADDRAIADLSCSVFAFRQETLAERPETVRGFLTAIDEASAAINADKTRWGDLLAAQQLLPPDLLAGYTLPDYPAAAVPTAAQFTDVTRWLLESERLTQSPDYATVITAAYLK